VLNNVTGSYPHVEFSGTNPGDLGFEATIAVPVGDTNSGMVATLYSYDPDTKEMVITGTATVDDKGYAKFPMTSTGDCTVVITPEGVLSPGDPALYDAGVLTYEDTEANKLNDSSRLRLTDIFSFRGNNTAWLFIVAFLSAAICLIILFLPAMQAQDREEDRGDYL
jgi:hypothetical protein